MPGHVRNKGMYAVGRLDNWGAGITAGNAAEGSRVTEKPRQPTEIDAAALIVAIANRRDREAFAELFGHYAPRLKAYMLRLGAANDFAEEMAQETMLTVWRKAGLFDPARAAPAAWIFTILRNRR